MSEQMQAAQDAMIQWLSQEHEMGKAPVKIKCVGEFDLHDLHYYMFKFKKSLLGKWLLGVCGGYKGDEKENNGHINSEMELYIPANAQIKAMALVEKTRTYSINLADEYNELDADAATITAEENYSAGSFVGFVLLDSCQWDLTQTKNVLQEDWCIEITSAEVMKEPLTENTEKNVESILWKIDDITVSVNLVSAPLPNEEAEIYAGNNYLWPDAVEVTKKHNAHIMIAALGSGQSAIEIGELFVKICCCFLKQENALGIYTSGTVFQPKFYIHVANMMRKGSLPLFNWIFFGLYPSEEKCNAYTYGMAAFGKDEMEVVQSDIDPQELRDLLFNISYYILSEGTTLKDGQTIGFSENQKLKISRSAGIALDSDTLKIEVL